jgi:hypothetical protein
LAQLVQTDNYRGITCPVSKQRHQATPLAANLNLADESTATFSFTAGPETVTSSTFNPSFSRLKISTDAAGNITAWDIDVAIGSGGGLFHSRT